MMAQKFLYNVLAATCLCFLLALGAWNTSINPTQRTTARYDKELKREVTQVSRKQTTDNNRYNLSRIYGDVQRYIDKARNDSRVEAVQNNIKSFVNKIVNTLNITVSKQPQNQSIPSNDTVRKQQEFITEPLEETKEPKTKQYKILCWILADPQFMQSKVKHQMATWARRCDKLLIMSSQKDPTFPVVVLNGTEGRKHNAKKSRLAWTYVYKHHYHEYDFFIKTDTDTYLAVENLREFLSDKSPYKPYIYGHAFHPKGWSFTYTSGGPGILLTKASVRKLVDEAYVKYPDCMADGEGEDYKTARCLSKVGGKVRDTRDSQGKERFLVFSVEHLIFGKFPKWYNGYDVHNSQKGDMCCSDYPISFHYVSPKNMYLLEYWLYHAKVHGKGNVTEPWPEIKGEP